MSTPITKGMSVRRNTITGIYYITDHAGSSRAQTATGTPLSEALAHQFAAAPDLYEALDETLGEMKALMAKWPPYTGGQNIADRADAALRKARGEAS
jgi:hypothetical protein